jgi:hypothetical protein
MRLGWYSETDSGSGELGSEGTDFGNGPELNYKGTYTAKHKPEEEDENGG